jgi:uncharacterized protein (DUF1697 family)
VVAIALLRGVNVGGRRILPMKDLAALFVAAGCDDARTYIQSGNVVVRARRALAGGAGAIERAIHARFGFHVPVVMRTADELRGLAASNPFLKAGADPDTLHVAFLADTPPADRASTLDPARSPPDAFHLRGRDVYLHLPNGLARSKLTNAYLDARLGTTATIRNWRTLLALIELAEQGARA